MYIHTSLRILWIELESDTPLPLRLSVVDRDFLAGKRIGAVRCAALLR